MGIEPNPHYPLMMNIRKIFILIIIKICYIINMAEEIAKELKIIYDIDPNYNEIYILYKGLLMV